MTKSKKKKIELAMTDGPPFIVLEGADFERMMKEVEGCVFAGMKSYHIALDKLREGVRSAIYNYFVDRYVAVEIYGSNLHKLRKPAARMLEVLQYETNRNQALFVLDGSPGKLGYMDLRYEALLIELKKFLAAISPPIKRKKERPTRTDLRALVERLANEWFSATDKPFTRNWYKGKPTTPAMQFVYAVVKFAHPKSLTALPKMTENVMKELLDTRSGNSPPLV